MNDVLNVHVVQHAYLSLWALIWVPSIICTSSNHARIGNGDLLMQSGVFDNCLWSNQFSCFFCWCSTFFFCLNRQLICNLNNTIESNQSVNLSLFHSHGDFSWTIFCACWTILYFCLVYFICFYAYVCMYAWLKHARPSVIILQRDSISYYYYVYFVRKKPFETEIHIFFSRVWSNEKSQFSYWGIFVGFFFSTVKNDFFFSFKNVRIMMENCW